MKILIDNGHGIQTKGKRSPDGTRWHTATGWSCYTCKGETQSDTLANCLYQAAIKNFPGKRIRTDYSDNDPDWEENLPRTSLWITIQTWTSFRAKPANKQS